MMRLMQWSSPSGRDRAGRRLAVALAWVVLLMLALAPLTMAQDAALQYEERGDGIHIVDEAGVLSGADEDSTQEDLQVLIDETGVDIVVYTQRKDRVGARKGAQQEAAALLEEWDVGGEDGTGVVMLWNISEDGSIARNGVAVGAGFSDIDGAALDESINTVVRTGFRDKRWADALRVGLLELRNELLATQVEPTPEPGIVATPPPRAGTTRRPTSGIRPSIGPTPQAGPGYPDPAIGVTVYDYAEVLDADTIARLRSSIDTIEERTGAEIVVYTQFKAGADAARTERDAAALIDQWGVGRQGFDDGMAIFFNLSDECHGQVQLYAAPGFEASYLSNAERQAIYEDEMLPALRDCDFDAALIAAIETIDGSTTAEHASNLQLARQVDAVAGLIVAPLLLIGLVGWAGWSWLRYGRDPIYIDDDSILMPAPPPGLSPAAAAVIVDGRAKRHALTTAMVDLAARGEISFRADEDVRSKMSIDITVPDQRDARLARNRRLPLGGAEKYALDELKRLGGAIRTIDPDEVPRFAKSVGGFNDRLEDAVAAHGWFSESPGDSIDRWSRRAALVLIGGVAGAFFGIRLPSTGLLLVGVAAIVGAVAMFIIARTMPQRTMEGARMFAQLAAYRRTLQKTLESSRTMDQVVASHALPWVETPDQAVVWSYALGLHEEAEEVLDRSMEDVRTGGASPTRTYFPLWYGIGARSGARISGGAKAPTAGLFSSGVVPDFTAMTAALSTIGNAPSSSGGGGFSGGGSGGGGGGAGGGF